MSEEVVDNGQANTDPAVDEPAAVETPTAEPEKAEGQEQEAVEYSDFSVPEGIELDTEVLGEFLPMAKDLKLNQEQAQRLVDMGSKLVAKMQQQSIDGFQKQKSDWADQSRADSEIGGREFDANLGIAIKAIDAFGTPELKTLLEDSGIGNHPEIVRFAYKIGKAIGEDRNLVSGNNPGQKDILKAMYPTM